MLLELNSGQEERISDIYRTQYVTFEITIYDKIPMKGWSSELYFILYISIQPLSIQVMMSTNGRP